MGLTFVPFLLWSSLSCSAFFWGEPSPHPHPYSPGGGWGGISECGSGLGNYSLLLAPVPLQGPDCEGVIFGIKNVQAPCEILTIFSVLWHFIFSPGPVLWLPDVKSQFIGKGPDAGKDWRQEEKGVTEDEMVGWYHWLNGHEFEQTLGDGEGQGSLVCCSPRGCKELDTTEWLNNFSRGCSQADRAWSWGFSYWKSRAGSRAPGQLLAALWGQWLWWVDTKGTCVTWGSCSPSLFGRGPWLFRQDWLGVGLIRSAVPGSPVGGPPKQSLN